MYPKAKKLIKTPKKKFKKSKITVVNQVNPLVSIIKEYYRGKSNEEVEINASMLPPSANKLYEKGVRFSAKHNKNVIHASNHADVEIFRNFLWKVIRQSKVKFIPNGTVSVVLELYTSSWLNKDGTTKKLDSDNRLKSLMDALEESLGFPDELAYYHHIFKCISEPSKEGIRVTLYDTPPIIYH